MWGTFFIGIALCMVFLYLPGYFLFRAIRFSSFLSFVLSPFVSILMYGILCIVYEFAGIPAGWLTLFLPSSIICLAPFLVRISHNKGEAISAPHEKEDNVWACLLLYVCVSFAITLILFVKTLDGPGSFIPDNDATAHLNNIQHFLDSGKWSIISMGTYYPQAYTELSAMIAQALNVDAPFAANVLVATLLAIVFPVSILGFFSSIFARKPGIIACGCVAVLGLSGFPWHFLEFNQIGPNLVGNSLLPLGLLLFTLLTQKGQTQGAKVFFGLFFMLFICSCLFTHSNTAFTLGVFLVPYIVYLIFHRLEFSKSRFPTLLKMLAIILFLAVTFIVWFVCYKLPFLQSVVQYNWGPGAADTPANTIETILTLSYKNPAQFVAALFILVGFIYTLFNRRFLWLSISAILFAILFYVALACGGEIRQLLTGFWYTAGRRLYGAMCIACIPLLTLGVYATANILRTGASTLFRDHPHNATLCNLCFIATIALFAATNYFPSFSVPGPTGEITTTFGYIYESLETSNKPENSIIGQEERDFLEKAKEITGDELVFNLPYDGSAYAYCLSQVHTTGERLADNASQAGAALQEGLNNISTSEEVRNAANELGVGYVLYLDTPLGDSSTVATHIFDKEDWRGYLAIDENTPGFDLVLADGDMRLYKIDESLIAR